MKHIKEAVLGLRVDLKSGKFERLLAAEGLLPGKDFDDFPMYGQRKRCVINRRGAILKKDEESSRQGCPEDYVMVYQPAFYYKVVPIEKEEQESGTGYHLRIADYFISSTPHEGFRLHPAFYDVDGNPLDHIFLSAYKAGLYVADLQTYFNDNVDESSELDMWNDRLCSQIGYKPISGHRKLLTRSCVTKMAENLGSGWHQATIKTLAMDQLLMMIEFGTMNLQTAFGLGVSMFEGSGIGNDCAFTGATSELGDASGTALETTFDINGTIRTFTENGFLSVSYRGEENPYGDLFTFADGINIYGDGRNNGGIPYICSNYMFEENSNTGNYESAGFSLSNKAGFWSAIGYGNETYDWLLMASETDGDADMPVGDYEYVTPDLDGFRLVRRGGDWHYQDKNGMFLFQNHQKPGVTCESFHSRGVGARLIFVPKSE